jgi:hypothetical protein
VPLDACIGLAVPGRPIGPWSRRTGAPQASATGRNRNLTQWLRARRIRQVEQCPCGVRPDRTQAAGNEDHSHLVACSFWKELISV